MANKSSNKLTKLRSAFKKMNSFGKPRRDNNNSNDNNNNNNITPVSDMTEFHTVYVGKSMRPYHVTTQVLDHPVIQELVVRSDGCDGSVITVVGCEVVLFEHLLWMLQHSDVKSEPLDDLVSFYAY